HVCDVPAKRHLVHDRLLRRSNQPLPSGPNRARQFQSRIILRDDHHSCNHYLRSSPRHAAPASIRYYELLMATYFITGIAGFIGSALARAVLAQGDQVRGIDNLSTGKTENIAEILNRIDFREADLPPNPISPYAVAKLASEYYMISFYRCYGLETVCLRYFNIFGPRQDPSSPYSGVLAKFITQMLKGEQPTIFGDGTQSRDFTYV